MTPPDPQDTRPPDEPAPNPNIPVARPVSADAWLTEAVQVPPVPTGPSTWGAFWQLIGMLVLALIASELGILIFRVTGIPDPRWQQLLGTIFGGACCVVAALIWVRQSGETAAVLGWRTDRLMTESYIGLAAAVLILAALMMLSIGLYLLDPNLNRSEEARKAIQQALPPMSFPTMLAILVFVSIWEETIFRGFLLTRLHVIVKRWWLAVLLGASLFALGHVYEGWLAVSLIAGLGIAFGVLFVWRKHLLACIVCHTIFNTVMLVLMQLASKIDVAAKN